MYEFRIGAVLSDTLKVLRRYYLPFAALALLVQVLDEFQNVLFTSWLAVNMDEIGGVDPLYWIDVIIDMFFGCLLAGPVTYGTYRHLQGRSETVVGMLDRGLALIPPVFLVSVVFVGLFFVGLFLLAIPAVIFLVVAWIVIPVVVIERPGVWASFRRSADLTKGYRWKIFGLHLVIYGPMIAVSLVIAAVGSSPGIWDLMIGAAYMALEILILTTIEAVGYFHLRRAREGIAIEQIAAVFD